jgi:hypothetical protein
MKGTFTRTYGVKVPFMRSGMEQGFPTCRVGGYRSGYRWAVNGGWSPRVVIGGLLLVGDHLGRGRTVP